MGIPVVVVRGILESGKTTFLIDSLKNGMFGDVGRALILSQEEGEIEYEEKELKSFGCGCRIVENKEDWNDSNLEKIIRETKPQVIFIEANEMWDFNELKMPIYFDIEQTIGLIDGTTFNIYLGNMRQRMVDMIKQCDLVIINRCQPTQETSQMKRNVRMINNSCTVISIGENGEELKLDSDLPFDVKGSEIDISLENFGVWYVDTFDSHARYDGKIVEFDCMAVFSKKLPPRSFVAGRMAMTCCANDIQLIGHLCAYSSKEDIKMPNKTWIHLRARIHYLKIKGSNEDQLVLEYLSHEKIEPPKEEDQTVNLV